ncbi:MAG: hypothetical protein AVDCRST_MAG70-2208 [uncultured Thermomicrobiales bacterium]|uniref:Rieske domain-containing protein n=1 Tax=uncultured Thermomicrobiales bacterium TaxID=1645740 RepID=A0A6J4V3D7_9BACT|nr:MAG: hypothetical protein AVDCRST_MAG70-2208 [uncultured Thermomicrobiales bacterium]
MTDPDPMSEQEFRTVAMALDEAVRNFETLPFPEIREQVFELLQMVDALHRAGLTRLVDLLDGPARVALVERAALDPIAGTLLALYDLIPEPPAPTAIPAAAGAEGTVSFIPLGQIGRAPARALRRPDFVDLARLEDVPPGTMRGVEADGVRALLANVAGEIFAVRDSCPGGVVPLSLGAFTPPVVVCPWHNEAFDVRTGKRADGETGPGLDVLPVSVQGGTIRLAMTATTKGNGAGRTVPRP